MCNYLDTVCILLPALFWITLGERNTESDNINTRGTVITVLIKGVSSFKVDYKGTPTLIIRIAARAGVAGGVKRFLNSLSILPQEDIQVIIPDIINSPQTPITRMSCGKDSI